MKIFTYFIFILTLIVVIVNLFAINLIRNPNDFNILINLGILKDHSQQSVTHFMVFVLGISFTSCLLLIISFILVTKQLFFRKNDF